MTIQSILFNKKFWSTSRAHQYLLRHHFKDQGVDEKENFLRYRQTDVDHTKKFYTKTLKNGVEYVIMY